METLQKDETLIRGYGGIVSQLADRNYLSRGWAVIFVSAYFYRFVL